jgi:formate dehydrogenase beta subunit
MVLIYEGQMGSETGRPEKVEDMQTSQNRFRVHPGRGRKSGRYANRGRQIDPAAVSEVRFVLGDRSRRRDLLIEHLHLIQDHFNGLKPAHLHALAEEMKLPMAEVFEVASFYAHFDILDDTDEKLPEITIRVCDSLSCEMAGALTLAGDLAEQLGDQARILTAPCMGRCEQAPVAEVGHNHIGCATADRIFAAVAHGEMHPEVPEGIPLDVYRANGGYELLIACRSGERSVEGISGILSDAGLRGLGGAGFPAARKWQFVRAEPGPRYLCINADEGEPGTFKDRFYLERDPHRFLEGMLITAWAIEAETCFIYVRDEYPGIRLRLLEEIAALEDCGLMEPGRIVVRRGAGAYICGEESALIESIEGKRGLPRHRPPYVAQVGAFGRPTLVHNVETVFWIREIVEKGAAWFTSHGRHERTGLRSFSVSGRVKEPGVKLAPAGISVRELIDEYCGGMADGHAFKAYLPGGASGGILPAAMGDIPLDFDTLQRHGCFIGSAAVVVLSDRDNMRDVALNLMRFFADESCGQCTPCRNGTAAAVVLMEEPVWDANLLEELSVAMADASICGLGQAAPNPVMSVLKHFADEVVRAPVVTDDE